MALLTPVTVSLPLKVRQVDPEGAVGSLSLVLGVGSLFALVANPFFGKLSDRTTLPVRHAPPLAYFRRAPSAGST
jgi:MFS family permease